MTVRRRQNSAPVIKVCGIQSIGEAHEAITAGANTLGFLLGLTHVAGDEITPDTARKIVANLPCHVRTVMVTHLLDPGQIAAIARAVGVSAIQIHDDLTIDGIEELRRLVPGLELIKAVHVTGPITLDKARRYAPHVDMLLLDSRTKQRLGGTGQTHDWRISRRIVEAGDIPVILAGGLNPANVTQAISEVRPAGIDANSGLERAGGTKDFGKMKAFVAAGRQCRFEAPRGETHDIIKKLDI